MDKTFEKNDFSKRVKSMLKVDVRRAFTTPLFYIMVGISFVIPILILVMTGMMEGSVTINPQTGEESIMQGFENVWQILGGATISADTNAQMSMDLVSMCNIHLLYFIIAVFVCVFISDDFRSGYAKNLFTVRAKKSDYVISKTVIGFITSAAMLTAFFLGALIGGKIIGISFAMDGFNTFNLICSILSKISLSLLFVSVYVIMSVVGKQRLWLSLLLSFGVGMFMFTIAPMVSPLSSGILNVVLCLGGGALFAIGLGSISNIILQKTSLV